VVALHGSLSPLQPAAYGSVASTEDLADKDLAWHQEVSKALEPPDLSASLNKNGPHKWLTDKLQPRHHGNTSLGVPLADQLSLFHHVKSTYSFDSEQG
jgi:hypothetical protein